MAESDDILSEAKEAFSAAETAEKHNRETYIEDIRFAMLGEQWDQEDLNQRQAEGRPCLTINKMPAFIRQVVNDSRQNKPSMQVHPADSKADPPTAQVLSGLLRNVEYTSDADIAYDTAIECAVAGGFGYWRVVLDRAFDDAVETDIMIRRIANPLSVYGDPKARSADGSDWDVGFVTDRLTKDQFERQYKDKANVDWSDNAWKKDSSWLNDDGVLIAEYWTREEVERAVIVTQDGDTIDFEQLESDPDLKAAMELGLIVEHGKRTVKSHRVMQRMMSGADILDTRKWPGSTIPIVPVYGVEIDVEGKRYFRSLINAAKDAQRNYNYWRSAATELLALAPRVPYIGVQGAFAVDDRWQTANRRSHAYLEYAQGTQMPQRQPMDTGSAAGALQEALNANDDMKAIIGLYDASLGARSNETSGRAIMARQREGDTSTFHFLDNLSRAIRRTGRIMIDLIPHAYGKERIIRVRGEDGKPANMQINKAYPVTDPKTGQPVQRPMVNPQTGQPVADPVTGDPILEAVTALHDLTAGKYDLTVKTGPSFTSRREEAATQMTEVMRAAPQIAPIVMPELIKNMDWPGADKIAAKMEKQAAGAIPPQAQKQMHDMQQKLQQAMAENQHLKTDQAADLAKVEAQKQIDMQKLANARELGMMEIEKDKEIERMKLDAQFEMLQRRAVAFGSQFSAPQPAPVGF